MSRLRLFGYYLPSLLSVVGRFYRLVARSDKRIVRFARVVARCGVVVNEDSSVNFNRGTAGFPVGILNVDDRIPTVDGIALRFEASTVNASIRCPFCISSCSKSVFTGVVAVIFISKESPSFPVIFS